jgi:hypothetical protein
VGLPDDVAGEVPVAILQLANTKEPSFETVVQQLRNAALKDLGPTEAPHAYVSLAELGLDQFPRTLSGKIQKRVLAERVREYFKDHEGDDTPLDTMTTEAVLLESWSNVSGVPVSSIDVRASVLAFADSITMMRLSMLVKKRLQKDLTVDDVMKNSNIHEQAELLDSRSVSSGSGPKNHRSGPPTADDMVHCNGDPSVAVTTEQVIGSFLQRLNLSWNDVEDVFPAPDTSFMYLNRRRPQTWNQRAIFLAPNISAETLGSTWKAVLAHHAILRTVAIATTTPSSQDPKHLFVVLRAAEPFWNCSTRTNLEVEDAEDLCSIFEDEWADSLAGPLVRTAFVQIKNSDTSAFVLVGNHAVFDNISMDLLFSDLETALSQNFPVKNIPPVPSHIPFKQFADQYYQFRSGKDAQEAVNFHTTRLRGIGDLQESLWPKSRAPGWFKGPDAGWTHSDGTPGDPSLRTPIDPPEDRHGLDGLTRTAVVHTLQAWKEEHGIMPHVILKVAVALFNMRKTGTTTALFANLEAGRRWPASSGDDSGSLPNPLSIAGPMFQVVLNHITLFRPDEPVLDILQRVQEEQKLLSEHSQAPLFLIQSLLPESDGKVFFDALRRQTYNWAPGVQTASGKFAEESPALVKFNRQALDDVGLAWTCGLRNQETFYVNASYDDCQLGKDEVYEYLGEVLSAVVWLADLKNAVEGVDACRFDGGDVGGLIKSLE